MTELKPCPFCGGVNIMVYKERLTAPDSAGNEFTFAVICDFNSCGCGASGGYRPTSIEARTAWNKRAEEA